MWTGLFELVVFQFNSAVKMKNRFIVSKIVEDSFSLGLRLFHMRRRTSHRAELYPQKFEKMDPSERNKLIGVIDSGTNTTRFVIFKAPELEELCSHSVEVIQICPQEGWVEQDPTELLNAIKHCVSESCTHLEYLGYQVSDIITLGITNQRETTVVWDKVTGEPLYNAIVWHDYRTNQLVDRILAHLPDQNQNHFKELSGLPISPYFSALKIRWLKDNIRGVRRACREKRCLAGTIDSWIIWNLTGGVNGGVHATDVTNASRTLLMNIETLNWDPSLLREFSIHPDMLPEIRSCSEIYGKVSDGGTLNGISISGVMGNQQASLVGQQCLKKGQAKNTYRKGCFLLCNTGDTCVRSASGLVTTVAYQFGRINRPIYALEGSVAVAGSALSWLQKNMGMLKDTETDPEIRAGAVNSTGDVYFVPAFSGLYAPYWRKDARGIICGLTGFTTKDHIIRAALEATCFQTRDIIQAMNKDCGFALSKVYADGALSSNDLLMQLQADLSGVPVLRSKETDTTSRGAAVAAGLADGINILLKPEFNKVLHDTFLPTTTIEERNQRYSKWKMAVERSLGWCITKKSDLMTNERFRLLSSVPMGLYVLGTFTMLAVSQMKR